MNARQIKRWKCVAKGMCFHFWENATQARKERLWKEIEGFIDELSPYKITSWEDSPNYPCDWFSEYFERYDHHWTSDGEYNNARENKVKFYDQLECIARASIDLITNSGCGVLGFNLGDLKRVFDGKVPKWVLQQYEGLTNETPDEVGIWL